MHAQLRMGVLSRLGFNGASASWLAHHLNSHSPVAVSHSVSQVDAAN